MEGILLVLLIDDDDRVRKTVAIMLKYLGHDVRQAENGSIGIDMFQQCDPDLVITDIIMPDKEGIETITEIRNLKPDAPIIAMSGGGRIKNTDFLKLAGSIGATVTLNKPFDDEELSAAITRATQPRLR